MDVVLENRTISMILMVPDVDTVPSSSTPIIERLDRSDIFESSSMIKHGQTSGSDPLSSIPVYQGSIIRIEQHSDDRNRSDLIIRVPNFQRLPSPPTDTESKSSTQIKRRAPICPLLHGPKSHLSTTSNTYHVDHLHLSQTRVVSANRLTTGLRSLSRAFTHGCKARRSSSFSEVTPPSALPDVEIMGEKLKISTLSNKNSKQSMPKLTPPKILSVKRKHSTMKKKETSSSIYNNTQTDFENNRIDLTPTSTIITTQYAEVKKHHSPKITSFLHRCTEEGDLYQETDPLDDNEQQHETIRLSFDVEQEFTAISKLISDIPASSIDDDSLSTHRYSTISVNVTDVRIPITDYDREGVLSAEPPSIGISNAFPPKPSLSPPTASKTDRSFRIQTSILQPDISVIRMGTSNLTTRIDRRLPGEKDFIEETSNLEQEQKDRSQIEQDWYGIIHSDEETFAECYEVTYHTDPQHQNEKGQCADQSSVLMKISLDPYEYRDLALKTTTWAPSLNPNEYEQIERDNSSDKNDRESQPAEKRDENLEHSESISKEQNTSTDNITRHRSHSIDDLSPTSHDQTSTYHQESITTSSSSSEMSSRHCTLQRSNSYNGFGIYVSTDVPTCREHLIHQVEEFSPGEQAGLKENDRILCINGTPVIQEDYTVVLQLLQTGLQTDTLDFDVVTNDAYEQFKSEIDQFYQ